MVSPARVLRKLVPVALGLIVLAALAPRASAQFDLTEVSAPGSATPFRVTKTDWTWEDLAGDGATSYSVYRSPQPDQGFECILDMHPSTTWSGDPMQPGPGNVLHYLVTAFDDVIDNRPGQRSDTTPRTRDVPCPRVPACRSGTPVAGRVPLRLVQVGAFTSPIDLSSPPGDYDRVFVLERAGRIMILNSDGSVNATPFLDFRANVRTGFERGSLGFAFHPDYANNGKFYVHHTAATAFDAPPGGQDSVAHVVEYTVSGANRDIADPFSRRLLIRQVQPFGNHNGGWIAFGPDGYLYISFGDGGSGGDPLNNGQNRGTFLGKLLRIDVDGRDAGLEYAVPPTNPFVGVGGVLPEIWSWGLRNAWRNSFDRLTGDLYIADVGQNAIEEVNVATAASGGGRGANYGWRLMEASACYNPGTGCDPVAQNLVVPDYEYRHTDGCSVTGGIAYRGCRMPDWQGWYFFADYCNDWLDAFNYQGGVGATRQRILPAGTLGGVISFGEDAAGEIYVVQELGGIVYRLEP